MSSTDPQATSDSPYAARPAPMDFDAFMAHVDDAQQSEQGIMVDADLFEELFGHLPTGRGARPEFIKALPRPTSSRSREETACPVCLQSLAAIETEEEYALAADNYFGDLEALGLRQLPCTHVLCARCTKQWLPLNNSCPLCRKTADDQAPHANVDTGTSETIERQRETEQMLSLFNALFGQRGQQSARKPDDEKESFSSMYS